MSCSLAIAAVAGIMSVVVYKYADLAQRYIGALLYPNTEINRRTKVTKQVYTDSNDLSTMIARVCCICNFPTKRLLVYGSLQHKVLVYQVSTWPEGNGSVSYMRHHTG